MSKENIVENLINYVEAQEGGDFDPSMLLSIMPDNMARRWQRTARAACYEFLLKQKDMELYMFSGDVRRYYHRNSTIS